MKLAVLSMVMAPMALGHTHVTNLFVNGVNQGDLMCLRAPADPATLTFPVEDLGSPDMACGLGGSIPVKRACPVPDGGILTFQYRKVPTDRSQGALDTSHKGPCAVYLKKVDNALYDTATGDGWFKIWDAGYGTNWCTVDMSNGGGLLSVNLPQGLLGGYYLVRPELLALHNANKGDPQYYLSCAQIYVQSSGKLVPQNTVSIPGYCQKGDVADSWNIYNGPPPNDYVPPGPAPANFISSISSNIASMSDGGKPDGCVLEVGSNWCGIEVPDYNDQAGCWKAAQNCWDQDKQCWSLAPGAMNNNCNIWSAKCQDLNTQCQNGNFNGPPNKGKELTPSKSTIQPPSPLGPTRTANSGNLIQVYGAANTSPYLDASLASSSIRTPVAMTTYAVKLQVKTTSDEQASPPPKATTSYPEDTTKHNHHWGHPPANGIRWSG